MTKYIKIAFQKAIVIDSLKVALVVGVILNLINQWQTIIDFHWSAVNYVKLALTFCVPYLVSTYASVKTELRNR